MDAEKRALLTADGSRVTLSSRPFQLLLFFVRHPGELLDKDRLMKAGWPETVVEENNLNQSIGAIRKALGESPGDHRFLVTEPGRGYRFVAPVRVVMARAGLDIGTGVRLGNGNSIERARDGPRTSGATSAHRRTLLIVVAVIAIAIIGAAVLMRSMRAPPAVTDRSIAVLPFENRSEARTGEQLPGTRHPG